MTKPDLLDVFAITGLALLSWGLWWIWPPLAPMVVGGLILALALVGATRGRTRNAG